ncbi:MAG: cryptochrome/photolyase family protein [Cyclobacteriaceae bacterium]|nr:cryptochrome/photolyase family protein [Cyclobacteriaceae bacterium]
MQAAIVFPHQLFHTVPFKKNTLIYLIEDELYFAQYRFHVQKLILHRASMKYYASLLTEKGHTVNYIDFNPKQPLEKVFKGFKKDKIETLHYTDTHDYLLERRIARYAKGCGLELEKHKSENFLLSPEEFQQQLGKGKKYFMAPFYIQQRKKFKLLLQDDGEPLGGRWSFDEDNRKKLPKNIQLPEVKTFTQNEFVKAARQHINKNFPDTYGSAEAFNYPTTHEEAKAALKDFLEKKMQHFGEYEDAIAKNESVLFHSVLTPALNVGLLSPQQIIDETLRMHAKKKFPINSLEGFIRQIIGWREFMRGVYHFEGVKERKTNFFGFRKKIPASFWKGETGIEPIDDSIKKVLANGYCHHIERLMLLGNFMLLCEFDPDEVYRWFMELFIDAYDWVMVPNVYGMSQYADGGFITTKPYVSGSNYVLKMSDYKKGEWCTVWDGLYWRFLFKHQEIFKKNQRMSMMINLVNKMDKDKLEAHLKVADNFLKKLK